MNNSIYKSARIAARKLNRLSTDEINNLLLALADAVEANIQEILENAKKDIDQILL